MLKIWGRSNSVNVKKVLWCLEELALPYERIDAGMLVGDREVDRAFFGRLASKFPDTHIAKFASEVLTKKKE